jgi:predicted MFS family arabinose efflux permease
VAAATPDPASRPGRQAVRLLAAARFASAGGSQAAQVALAYEVYERTSSATWVSASLVASAGVVGLLGPVSGRLSDRLDRRRVMVAAEVAGAVGWAAVLLADSPFALVLAALLATAANAPFRSASSASVPNLVRPEDRSWANSAIATAMNAALVVGPLVGGALIGVAGARSVFGVNAVTFLVSAVLIARLPGRLSEGPTPGVTPPTSWRKALRDRRRSGLYAVTALSFGAFGITLVADLPLVDHFGGGSIGYALLTTLWGTGAVVGSMSTSRLPAGRERLALIAGTAAMAVSIGSISVMPNLPAAIVVGTIGGLGSGTAFAPWFSLLQGITADGERGTAFAIAETLEQSAFIAGMVVAGGVVGALGAQATYLLPGALLLTAAGVAIRLDHRWDRPPDGRLDEVAVGVDETSAEAAAVGA